MDAHATTFAIDRRGYGESGDTMPYSVDREYEDVAAVVDVAAQDHGGPVDLFGHSFGAMCALEAARRTTNLRRLVLYEPSVLADPRATGFAERAELLLAEGRREAVVVLLFRDVLRVAPEEIAKMRTQAAWQTRVRNAHLLVREDRAEGAFRFDAGRYRSLNIPTLLLLGAESPEFFRASTAAIAQALPRARIARLEGQQHMALSAAPNVVAEWIVPFLAQEWRQLDGPAQI